MSHSFTLHDLPKEERPRERMLHFGEQALSAQELLQLILGRGIKGESVAVTAQKLLSQFGNLQKISEASLEELSAIKGIGLAKATQIKAVFEIARRLANQTSSITPKDLSTPEAVAKVVRNKLNGHKKEHFFLICLDSKNKSIEEISMGTLNATLIHPREVFSEAIKNHASSVIIAHNHPSGSLEPSTQDLEITHQLVAAGNLLNIHVLDHVIVTRNDYFSLKRAKLL